MERILLLVDDEEDIGAALTRVLRHDGYTILRARSGREGLALLAQHKVGVIVSDQRMPEMSGVELLSRVKDLYPSTVRIVLTGFADLNLVMDAINCGAIYKFISKPWENEMLSANVLEAFEYGELMQKKEHLSLEIQGANATLASLSLDLAKLVEQRDRQIERLTYYDALTNLPNRALFLDRVNQGLAQAQQDNSILALLLVSLNQSQYSDKRDTHPVGDQLLLIVAEKLAKHTRQGDTVAYFGGGRFGFVLTSLKRVDDTSEIARNIVNLLTISPVLIEGHEIYISVHIGIGSYPLDGICPNDLIKNAENALSHARKRQFEDRMQ